MVLVEDTGHPICGQVFQSHPTPEHSQVLKGDKTEVIWHHCILPVSTSIKQGSRCQLLISL